MTATTAAPAPAARPGPLAGPPGLRPPAVDYPADGTVWPLTRLVWRPVPVPPATPLPGDAPWAPGRTVVLVNGRPETAEAVAAALRAAGSATVLRFAPAMGASPDRMVAAAADLVRGGGGAGRVDAVVDLTVEPPFRLDRPEDWETPLARTVAVLRAVYEPWAAEPDATRLRYLAVTWQGGLMGYPASDPAIDGPDRRQPDAVQPLGGIWAGLAKTLPRELPNLNVRVLDLDPEAPGGPWGPSGVAGVAPAELEARGLFEIGYRGGRRFGLVAGREAPPRPAIDLGPEDTVLVSGGGRGIGFALARALARGFGCRVVVTGRHPLPADEPWLRLDDDEFEAHRLAALRAAGNRKQLPALRRTLELQRHLRTLQEHLREAAAAGLPIEYRPCDVTSAPAVATLVAGLGSSLSAVVHNAGVDFPARLPAKSWEAFATTVRTKVGGFLHLLRALDAAPGARRRLELLCTVGSLTGRWGGMVGQLDYGAANDGVARLGLWAAAAGPTPVQTLCWPTWERLGMIANYDATLRYMSAVNVEEGVYRWQRELLGAGSGEITFMGRVGDFLTPVQLRGFLPADDLPDAPRLRTRLHALGDVSRYRPGQAIRTTVRLAPGSLPAAADLSVRGAPAVPATVLLECAIDLGTWATPTGSAGQPWHLHTLRDVRLWLDALTCPSDEPYAFTCDAEGDWDGRAWKVTVSLDRIPGSGGAPVPLMRLRLGYVAAPLPARVVSNPASGSPLAPANDAGPDFAPDRSCYGWRGLILAPVRWRGHPERPGARRLADVRPVPPADVWAVPHPPLPALPFAHLEHALQAAVALAAPPTASAGPSPACLLVREVRRYQSPAAWDRLASPGADAGEGDWLAGDGDGRVGLALAGVCLTAEPGAAP